MCKKQKSKQKKGWTQYKRVWFLCTKPPDRNGHKKQEVTACVQKQSTRQTRPADQLKRKGKQTWGKKKNCVGSGKWNSLMFQELSHYSLCTPAMSKFKNNLSTKDQKKMSSQKALEDAQFPDLLTPAGWRKLWVNSGVQATEH